MAMCEHCVDESCCGICTPTLEPEVVGENEETKPTDNLGGSEKNKGGRPAFYKTPEELEEKIDEYFKKGVKEREVIVGRAPNQKVVKIPVPTMSGLAYYLGFESRQSCYAYENKEEFSYTIKRARLFIEQEYEEQLQHGNTVGAIFALKNMGWKDKTEQDITTTLKTSSPDDYTDEELKIMLKERQK